MATTIVTVDEEELEIPTCMIEDVRNFFVACSSVLQLEIILPSSSLSKGDLLRRFEPEYMESRDQGGGQAKSGAATTMDQRPNRIMISVSSRTEFKQGG